MPVYVDDLCIPADVENGRGAKLHGKWSHLYADTHEELVAFAGQIGLRPEWIQDEGTPGEHFDVVMTKRAKAIEKGAQAVSWRDAGLFFAERRHAMEDKPAMEQCSMEEPCEREGCGACYPDEDEVMRQGLEERETQAQGRAKGAFAELDKAQTDSHQARELDRQAGLAYKTGEFSTALRHLEAARMLDPALPELADHMQRVRTAERAAVAKVTEPRDLGELADTFAERLGPQERYEHQRDTNRGEPTEPCDAPRGEAQCGELGHLYPAGRRCDEHRPRQMEPANKELGQ
jgi:Protein of unknown function (DUF4031)